ncbi:MAG: exodeoxyribonuclease VII large subunit [Chromatocurvus sp.]
MSATKTSPNPTLSVSQLNRKARTLLESHFDWVWVEGEMSNFVCPSSGHWYFSLKDDGAQVRCAMFRNRNARLRFRPGNGDQVRLRARVSLYEGRGEFQLVVEFMEPAGAGALQARFEVLRDLLRCEGLLDAERKRALPQRIRHIGVITSPTGAAIHDILTVLRRRCPLIAVSLLPVAVQGREAVEEIAGAIERANRWQQGGACDFDVLLIGRGGGSLEDLWAFNEERVARAIAASKLPTVCAVGHETDISIADLVADQRAATPSAAAELLSPDQSAWLERLRRHEHDLKKHLQRNLHRLRREIQHLRARLKHPGTAIRERSQRLDDIEQRLCRAQRLQLTRYRTRVASLATALRQRNPAPYIREQNSMLTITEQRLQRAMEQRVQDRAARLRELSQLLNTLSPLATLQRGYAIVSDSDNGILRDARKTQPGDRLQARLAIGTLQLQVLTAGTDSDDTR